MDKVEDFYRLLCEDLKDKRKTVMELAREIKKAEDEIAGLIKLKQTIEQTYSKVIRPAREKAIKATSVPELIKNYMIHNPNRIVNKNELMTVVKEVRDDLDREKIRQNTDSALWRLSRDGVIRRINSGVYELAHVNQTI